MEEVKKAGNNFFLEKKYEEAIEKYTEALELCETDKEKSTIHSNLSSSYCKLENYEDALIHAKNSIKLNLEWYKAWYRLSFVLFKMDKIEDSKKAITKTLEYCEKNNINEKYITDLRNDIFKDEIEYNVLNDDIDMNSNNFNFDNFAPMMEQMMKNDKIKEKLNKDSFKNKMMNNKDNPMSLLSDPDMMEVMGEMMKSFNPNIK